MSYETHDSDNGLAFVNHTQRGPRREEETTFMLPR